MAEDFRFRHYFDHQFPSPGKYAYDPDPAAYRMFQAWLEKARAEGLDAQPFKVGALNQIRLLHDAARYPDFSIRNLCANAVVWDVRVLSRRSMRTSSGVGGVPTSVV